MKTRSSHILIEALSRTLNRTHHIDSEKALTNLITGNFRFDSNQVDAIMRYLVSRKPIVVLRYSSLVMDEFKVYLFQRRLRPIYTEIGFWLRYRSIKRKWITPLIEFNRLMADTIVPVLDGCLNLRENGLYRQTFIEAYRTGKLLEESLQIQNKGFFRKRRAVNRAIRTIRQLRKQQKLGFLQHFHEMEALISVCEKGLCKRFALATLEPRIELTQLFNPTIPLSRTMDFKASSGVSWATFPPDEVYPKAFEAIVSCVLLANKGLTIPALRSVVPRVDGVYWHINLTKSGRLSRNSRSNFTETIRTVQKELSSGKSCFTLLYEPELMSHDHLSPEIIELIEQFKRSPQSTLILATAETIEPSSCEFEVNEISFVNSIAPRSEEFLYLATGGVIAG